MGVALSCQVKGVGVSCQAGGGEWECPVSCVCRTRRHYPSGRSRAVCPRPHPTGFPCSQLCRDRGLHKYEVLQDSLTPESRCHSADLPSRPASVSAMREADPSEEAVKKKATAQLVSRRSTCMLCLPAHPHSLPPAHPLKY